ncbi:MAG: transcriptional repressor LexA [Bryobacteraceae bacterium]|nr:transcriptional repressor LexA [Bryobacteraceae bacterium]
MDTPSAMQEKILRFIEDFSERRGMPPTVREIGDRFGIKSSSVFWHLKRMEKKGLLRRTGAARSIELLGKPRHDQGIPVLGQVAAGAPLLAVENIDGYLPVDRRAYRDGNVFALRVKGESMVEAGILDGDAVIVREQPDAENGTIVVALVDDEATVKRFHREGHVIRLQPANSAMAPLLIDAARQDVRIVGRVLGVFRDLN